MACIGDGLQEKSFQGILETIDNCTINHARTDKNGRNEREFDLLTFREKE